MSTRTVSILRRASLLISGLLMGAAAALFAASGVAYATRRGDAKPPAGLVLVIGVFGGLAMTSLALSPRPFQNGGVGNMERTLDSLDETRACLDRTTASLEAMKRDAINDIEAEVSAASELAG